MTQENHTTRYRFGVHELDLERGELRRSGLLVRLPAQPLRLLGLLVSRAGEAVSREEIRRHVWPDEVHVEFEQGINACIKQIRSALGDYAEIPRVIETIPRGGYRFLLPVETIASPPAAASQATAAAVGTRDVIPQWTWRRTLWVAAALAGLIALGAVVRSGIAERGFLGARGFGASSDARPVLAVLPFSLFAEGKEDEFFRGALTDELITQLGRRYGGRLSVIARTSVMKYLYTKEGLDTIGRSLGADYVLEGSVRRVGTRIRVQAQLVRVADGSHVWASAFQRESDDLMALQVELGQTIAEGLALKLLPPDSRMAAAATKPEAYEDYLRGRGFLAASRFGEARAPLERAVAVDPGFAPAWAALARVYNAAPPQTAVTGGGMRALARDSVSRALALDDDLPEAHLTLATMQFYRDYDFEGARRSFERAIALNPAYAEAHEAFAGYFSIFGRHAEAVAEVQQARRLDPLSSMTNSDVGWYYYFARRYDEAVEHSQRTLDLDPGFFWANLCIQLSYLERPDWKGAIEPARREMTRAGASRELLGDLASTDRKTALGAYWRWRLQSMQERSRKTFVDPSTFAQIHMALGEGAQALDELETSFETRTGWILPFLAVDPVFDPLRGDPRFKDLLARIGVSPKVS